MANLSDLVAAIEDRLKNAAVLAGASVLTEDVQDLGTEIDKAIADIGMLILIGQPKWKNLKPDNQAAEMGLVIEIAIGEAPTIWRDKRAAPPNPPCVDVAQYVTQLLQGFKVGGYRYLSVQSGNPVRDRKRQLYEVVAAVKWLVPETAG
jgi:hypothetical protein